MEEIIREYNNEKEIQKMKQQILEEYANAILSPKSITKESLVIFLEEITKIKKWDDAKVSQEYCELFDIPF